MFSPNGVGRRIVRGFGAGTSCCTSGYGTIPLHLSVPQFDQPGAGRGGIVVVGNDNDGGAPLPVDHLEQLQAAVREETLQRVRVAIRAMSHLNIPRAEDISETRRLDDLVAEHCMKY